MISVLMVTITVVSSNYMLEGTFRRYDSDLQDRKIESTINDLILNFDTKIMGWENDILNKIGRNALENRLIVKIKDNQNKIIWNGFLYQNGVMADLIKNMAVNPEYRIEKSENDLINKNMKIKIRDISLGEVDFYYYGTYYYSSNDAELISRLNIMFLSTSVLSLIIAVLVGLYMSKEIAGPVVKVTDLAKAIAKNDFKEKIDCNSDIVEIAGLLNSINHLSLTLNNNRDLRKRMTVDIAHELRTPLSILQSHLEAIVEGVWQASIDRIKSCYDEVVRLGKLVDNLKKIDDMDSGAFNLDKKRFSVDEFLKNIYLNFMADFKKRNIKFSLFIKDNIEINSDKDRLGQVVINIVSNALKYTKNGGEVSISLEKVGKKAIISISDNGIGIEQKDIPFIFERLYRTDTSRAKTTGGSGVGLTIAKYQINALGGEILVNSKIGKGSTFKIIL